MAIIGRLYAACLHALHICPPLSAVPNTTLDSTNRLIDDLMLLHQHHCSLVLPVWRYRRVTCSLYCCNLSAHTIHIARFIPPVLFLIHPLCQMICAQCWHRIRCHHICRPRRRTATRTNIASTIVASVAPRAAPFRSQSCAAAAKSNVVPTDYSTCGGGGNSQQRYPKDRCWMKHKYFWDIFGILKFVQTKNGRIKNK